MPYNFIYKSILLGAVFYLSACTHTNIRQKFYQDRACAEIKYQCLNPMNDLKPQGKINPQEAEMYRENNLMLEVYYPGFWDGVTDEKVKLDWMRKVHEIAKKYYLPYQPTDGEIAMMAHICAIVGLDFEANPKYSFLVKKLKDPKLDPAVASSYIINYLRFEVLQKNYNVGGDHYNSWSLKDVQDGMPPITRYIPDFYTEAKPHNPDEDVREKLNQLLEQGK